MSRHELTDEEFAQIKDLLPGREGTPGRSAEDNRKFIHAVRWIAKTGAPWRDLPEEFGNWNSVYQRFNRWCKQGVWQAIAAVLGADFDWEELQLDSTIVRAHQHAAGGKGGRSNRRSAVPAGV